MQPISGRNAAWTTFAIVALPAIPQCNQLPYVALRLAALGDGDLLGQSASMELRYVNELR